MPEKSVDLNNLEALFNHQIEFAKRIFEDKGEVLPMWVGQDESGAVYPMTVLFNTQEEKAQAAEAIKMLFERNNIIRYVSMVESWMVITDQAVDALTIRPSQHPDRKEVIIIAAEEVGREGMVGYLEIIRKDDGKVELSEFKDQPRGSSACGDFAEILPNSKQTRH